MSLHLVVRPSVPTIRHARTDPQASGGACLHWPPISETIGWIPGRNRMGKVPIFAKYWINRMGNLVGSICNIVIASCMKVPNGKLVPVVPLSSWRMAPLSESLFLLISSFTSGQISFCSIIMNNDLSKFPAQSFLAQSLRILPKKCSSQWVPSDPRWTGRPSLITFESE